MTVIFESEMIDEREQCHIGQQANYSKILLESPNLVEFESNLSSLF